MRGRLYSKVYQETSETGAVKLTQAAGAAEMGRGAIVKVMNHGPYPAREREGKMLHLSSSRDTIHGWFTAEAKATAIYCCVCQRKMLKII